MVSAVLVLGHPLLVLVLAVVLPRLFLRRLLGEDVPFAPDDLGEVVDHVDFLEELLLFDHLDHSVDADTVVALPNVHGGHVQLRTALLPPGVQETRVLVEDLVVVEHAEAFRFFY